MGKANPLRTCGCDAVELMDGKTIRLVHGRYINGLLRTPLKLLLNILNKQKKVSFRS